MSRCASKCPHLQLIVTHTNAIRGHCLRYSTDLKTNPYPAYRNSGPYRCQACVDQVVPQERVAPQPQMVFFEVPTMIQEFKFDFGSISSFWGRWGVPLAPPPAPPPVVPLRPPLTVLSTIDPAGPDVEVEHPTMPPCIIDPEDP